MDSTNSSIIAAAPPPSGVTPDFVNGESIAFRLYVVSIFFALLGLAFLCTRLFAASFILKKWHLDDSLILIAWIVAVINSIVALVQTRFGLGKHIWDVPLVDFQMFLKIGIIGGALTYNIATLFIKMSILCFYLRFSIERAFRFAVYFVMLVTVGYTLPNAILALYACRPMSAYWDFTVQKEHCVNLDATFHTANTLNMVTDFAILLLPIWMLRPMRVPLSKKIGVSLILMAGGFVCAVSLMRMIRAFMGIFDPDISFHYTENLIWWIVEMQFGIVCACLPTIKPFVKRYFPGLPFFDPQFEQRIVSSFRLSNRVARFNGESLETNKGPSSEDKTDVLKAKPSGSSVGSDEAKG